MPYIASPWAIAWLEVVLPDPPLSPARTMVLAILEVPLPAKTQSKFRLA
jgi:hypothetical protein